MSIKIRPQRSVSQTQRELFGERYVGAHISKLRAPDWAQRAIINFMKAPKYFLVFCGNPGIGKTYLCAALVEFALSHFNSFRYWNESELLKRVRSSIAEYGDGDYLETLKLLIDDEFVIIDDIGSTGLNEWRKEVIFDAIDERYCSTMPTVITSNFSKSDIEKLFHERFSSRLFAQENTIIEIHNLPDLRQENL